MYSNFGYGVLSRALMAATASSFFELLQRDVLIPLGLTGTCLDLSEPPGRLVGHDAAGRAVPDWHNPSLPGCGCLWSTIVDLHAYLEANMHPDRTPLADAIRLVHTSRDHAATDPETGLAWLMADTPAGIVH